MIRATEAHRAAIETVLEARPERAMFLLGNLEEFGVEGSGHPRATTFWIDDAAAPRVVLGLTEFGMALIEAPDGADLDPAAAHLRGRPLRGLSGPAPAARALERSLGLEAASRRHGRDEPQFALDLDALRLPDGSGTLGPVDRETAVAWRIAYEKELHLGRSDPEEAARQVDDWMAKDRYRMLWAGDRPLALTGFNATLPGIVQIGGVYVPPALRGRRHAGRAVGLHLREARARGACRATLFAASETAVRAYLPLGFERIGDYALILFDGEVTP